MDQYRRSQQVVTQHLRDGTRPIQQCQQNLEFVSKDKVSSRNRKYLSPANVLESIRSCSLSQPQRAQLQEVTFELKKLIFEPQ
jgi:hypothetical protein